MTLVIDTIHIENFMSFKSADLSLNDRGFVTVVGRNDNVCDNSVSNGSGKSSLWEALLWCLTGDTVRGTKDVVNNKSNEGTLVELKFVLNGKHYRVIRSKEHSIYKTNLKIFVDEKDVSGKGIRDSEKILSNLMSDVDTQLLSSVVILGQGLPQKFTNNTPSGRKEVLEKLTHSDFMIDDLKKRVTQRQNMLSEKVSDTSTKLNGERSKKEVLARQRAEAESFLSKSVDDVKEKVGSYRAELTKLEEDVRSIEATKAELSTQISELQEKRLSIKEKGTQEILNIKQRQAELCEPIKTSIAELTAQRKQIEKVIKEKKSIKDVCPTCGQRISGVIIPDTTDDEKSLQSCDELLSEYDAQIKKINETFTAEEAELRKKYNDAYSECTFSINKLQGDLHKQSDALNQIDSEVLSINSKLNAVEAQYNEYQTLYKYNEEKLKQIDEDLTKSENEAGALESELEELNERWSIIRSFSTALSRDFRGVLLSGLIDYLNNKLKEFSNVVFNSDSVLFALDGNNISIKCNSKEYESLSSGERQKIDVMVQFALRDMLCNYLGFSCNMLVLDEVFDGLDSRGCEKIIDLMSECLSDVSSVFVVTHRQDLAIPSDGTIVVNKDRNGFSRII